MLRKGSRKYVRTCVRGPVRSRPQHVISYFRSWGRVKVVNPLNERGHFRQT